MELTLEQIQALKKEIEGIWTHLNNIEKQLSEKKTGEKKSEKKESKKKESEKSEKKEPSGDSFGKSTNETIEMLERMKQKISAQELENEQTEQDDLDLKIDETLIHANVNKALNEIKQQLGIRNP